MTVLSTDRLIGDCGAAFSCCNRDNVPSRRTMEKVGLSFWKEYAENNVPKVAYRMVY
jgi:hypothetical protein